MRALLVVALLALFACTFTVAQETAVADAPRFAETEHEDATTLAEQEADWSAMVAADTDEADEADEGEAEADEEADEEVDEEADEEADEESEEEADEESEDESGEEEADESEAEDESEEEADEEAEDRSDYVLAELKDNAVMTGFMEMVSQFIPTAARAADHMVHSLSSHQQAAADQQYAFGYAHGHADAMSNTAKDGEEESEEEGEEAAAEEEEGEEASSFVEGSAKAEEQHSLYPVPYYGGYPSVAGVYYQPHYPSMVPPQLPTWLPPPPYITPVPDKKDKGGDE
jgi:hypothetical protein